MKTEPTLPLAEPVKADALATTRDRLIDLAIAKGANAEQLASLLDTQLRWEANEARKAFIVALEEFKKEVPKIIKSKKVSFPTTSGGLTQYSHAELDKANDIIIPALMRVGLTHTWDCEDVNGRTTVTFVLRHTKSGHTEKMASLSGPADTSGGKNSIQAIGSTTSYLQRYTMFASLGLVPEGVDDDGRKGETMNENAITDYIIQMQDATDSTELKKVFGEAWKKAKSLLDMSAQERFRKVYETRKREIHG